MYCPYYQATVSPRHIWLVTGIIRNEPNIAFVRTLEGHPDILEFFVAPSYEEKFVSLMRYLSQRKLILSYEKQKNRLAP